jgi:hypothetical protein
MVLFDIVTPSVARTAIDCEYALPLIRSTVKPSTVTLLASISIVASVLSSSSLIVVLSGPAVDARVTFAVSMVRLSS